MASPYCVALLLRDEKVSMVLEQIRLLIYQFYAECLVVSLIGV